LLFAAPPDSIEGARVMPSGLCARSPVIVADTQQAVEQEQVHQMRLQAPEPPRCQNCRQSMDPTTKTLHYKRARFATHLPTAYLYSPSHFWIARQEGELWRVGLTKFATRMLGEMVDHGFAVEINAPVASGQIIGWVEGFKAISDLFCIAEGRFAGSNARLKEEIALLGKEPYSTGWLYAVTGKPDDKCVQIDAYVKILDKTIDKILKKEQASEA
jgi:glycine cleavage system H protein